MKRRSFLQIIGSLVPASLLAKSGTSKEEKKKVDTSLEKKKSWQEWADKCGKSPSTSVTYDTNLNITKQLFITKYPIKKGTVCSLVRGTSDQVEAGIGYLDQDLFVGIATEDSKYGTVWVTTNGTESVGIARNYLT